MQEKWTLKRRGQSLSAIQTERYENQKGAILEYSWDDETLTEVVVQDCPFGMCTVGEKLFISALVFLLLIALIISLRFSLLKTSAMDQF